MITVLLVIHLFVTLALIGVVLIQRSEGGGLGVGTSQGMGAFMSGRGTANLLTRTTSILAALFFALSLALALLNRGTTLRSNTSILDNPPPPARTAPGEAPAIQPHQGPATPPTPAQDNHAAEPPAAPATANHAAESPAAPVPDAAPPAASSTPAPAQGADKAREAPKPAGQ